MKILLILIAALIIFAVLAHQDFPPGQDIYHTLTLITAVLVNFYLIWLVWKFFKSILRTGKRLISGKDGSGPAGSKASARVNTDTSDGSADEKGGDLSHPTDRNDIRTSNMTSGRKSYTDEFKKEVAEAASQPGATLKSVGEQFGVNPTLVRNWKLQFGSEEHSGDDSSEKGVFLRSAEDPTVVNGLEAIENKLYETGKLVSVTGDSESEVSICYEWTGDYDDPDDEEGPWLIIRINADDPNDPDEEGAEALSDYVNEKVSDLMDEIEDAGTAEVLQGVFGQQVLLNGRKIY